MYLSISAAPASLCVVLGGEGQDVFKVIGEVFKVVEGCVAEAGSW